MGNLIRKVAGSVSGLSPFGEQGVASKLVDWILQRVERGGLISCLAGCMGSAGWFVIGFLQRDWRDMLFGWVAFWICAAVAFSFYRSEKNARLNASIAAEQRITDPRVPSRSVIPEVQKAIEKVALGSKKKKGKKRNGHSAS